jgi:hypothetical protein
MRGLTSEEYDALSHKLTGHCRVDHNYPADYTYVSAGILTEQLRAKLLANKRVEHYECGDTRHLRVSASGKVAMQIYRMMQSGTVEV